MKILLITPYFPPEVGSAAHLYYDMGEALQAKGHEITVLTGLPRYHVLGDQKKYRRRPFVWETYYGMRVLRIFTMDIPRNVPLFRGLDQFFGALCFAMGGLFLPSFDIALVYSPPLPSAWAALILSRVRGKAAILNVQDIFPQSAIDLGVLKNPLAIRIFRGMEALLYRHFPFIIVHSDGNRDYVINRGGPPDQVRVIPNWVDTKAIIPSERQNALRRALSLDSHFIVLFAGIMGYSQDLDTIINCADRLKDHQEIAFLLVGDGLEKPRLQARARELRLHNVHFLPMQSKAEYSKVLAASDLCLVTLRKEVKTPVVPSKILSIMAAGRPVLTSLPLDGDAPRLIKASGAGICLAPESPEAMAQAILQLSKDKALLHKMGVEGRRYTERHLSLKVGASLLEDLFAVAINKAQAEPGLKFI